MTQSSPVISGKHHLDTESGLRYEDHMYEFVFSYLAAWPCSLSPLLWPWFIRIHLVHASGQCTGGNWFILFHDLCRMLKDPRVLQACSWEAFYLHLSEVAKTPRSPTARKSSNWHWAQQLLMPSWTTTVHSNHCLPTLQELQPRIDVYVVSLQHSCKSVWNV